MATQTTLDTLDRRLARIEHLMALAVARSYRIKDLPAITGLSLRELERRAAAGMIPGRRKNPMGRAVTYNAAKIHAWVDAGMPLVRQRGR